ncbi:hypothetical protein NP493_225g03047 [Ridgeia piscesae]|uniref:T-complex protein 11-like protein 1 n=1 Tax=Ridgeia piscesae TaxID=27915 RepID=A0AAD9P068_RIDPI|nr:hypothetical protein NP493_225g03047 [Ridgeia piscesae]
MPSDASKSNGHHDKRPLSPRDNATVSNSPKNSPREKQQRVDEKRNNVSPLPFAVAASPPKFVSFEEIMKAANGVANMALAHEIAVKNDFRFEKMSPPENSIEGQVTKIVHKAFWDSLEEKLNENPPDLSQAIQLLSEVKRNLVDLLLPQHQRIRTQVDEVLDLELIEQQAEHRTLDFMYYANFVISLMAQLCAPLRDDEITHLKQLTDIVPLYREIFRVLDLMKMDMANFTLQQIRPYIQKQSVEYEANKFKQFLQTQEENGIDGLQFAKAWLERAFLKYNADAAETASSQNASATTSSPATPAAILNTAYMELLDWDENQVFPESLLMDEGRFMDLRNKTRWLALVSAILLVTYNTVGESIAGIKGFKESLKEQISILLPSTSEGDVAEMVVNVAGQINKEVQECLHKHDFPAMDEAKQSLLQGQIQSVASPDHSVHKVMKSRLMKFIQSLISQPQSRDVLLPPGFSAVSEELSHVCGQFLRLASHNRAVFGSYYTDIITKLLNDAQSATA